MLRTYGQYGPGDEAERRRQAFLGFQIKREVMKREKNRNSSALPPAHRGKEISAEVFEAHDRQIFDEAEPAPRQKGVCTC